MATIYNLNAERKRRQAPASAPKQAIITRKKPIPLKRKRARRKPIIVDHQFNLHQISSEPGDDAPPSA